MSDQPPPPKPKPGSLRDRIAAFEKSTPSTNAAPPPLAPRPKPGQVSWKPKQATPPDSPAADETSAPQPKKSSGGMSASDAKESIGKGVSLKERMAALQGKGAFGAPSPPIAPKPAVEKPKWKPPPTIAPPPEDTDEQEKEIAIEKSEDAPEQDSVPVEETPEAEEGEAAEVDPQEEERKRRAALAARMARLGGARVGMGPPVFGGPAYKKSQPKSGDSTPTSEHVKADEEPDLKSPPAPEVEAGSDEAAKKDYFESERKASDASSLLSPDPASSPATSPRIPSAMPVPAAPRRAAPPRRKPAKSPAPPPVEEPEVTNETIGDKEPEVGQVSVSADPVPESEQVAGKVLDPLVEDVRPSEPSALVDSPMVTSIEETPIPTIKTEVLEPEILSETPLAAEEPEAAHDETEEDETARRARVAERLAKSGGVNPFAPASQRKPSLPIESQAEQSAPETPQRTTSIRKSSTDSVSSSFSPPPARRSPQMGTTPPGPTTKPSMDSVRSRDIIDHDFDISSSSHPGISEEPERSMSVEEADITEQKVLHEPGADDEDLVPEASEEQPESRFEEAFREVPRPPLPAAGTRPVPADVQPMFVPPPPPPPVVPEYEPEHEDGAELAPPPPPRRTIPPPSQLIEDEDEQEETLAPPSVEPPRRLPPRPVLEDDGEMSDAPLPHPSRRSIPPPPPPAEEPAEEDDDEPKPVSASAPVRFVPPPPPESMPEEEEAETEEAEPKLEESTEEILPTPPRRAPSLEQQEEPLFIPPPPPKSANTVASIAQRRASQQVENVKLPSPTTHPEQMLVSTPALSVSDHSDDDQKGSEILDEEEGDPIDPSFYSPPSRRASALSPQAPAVPEPEQAPVEDEEQARRRTIAERMAKLGGIKFGAAPIPAPRPPPPPKRQESEDGNQGEGGVEIDADDKLELTEEEEERARKERIAAKMASMGGMRIGMQPFGMLSGRAPPPPSRPPPPESSSSSAPQQAPRHAAPPPPPPQDIDSEHESLATSDEGVRVEAEESEMEEVNYEDVQDEEEEVLPPPVPAREGRRSSGQYMPSHGRPPVPTTTPSRKSSAQSPASQTDAPPVPTARKSSASQPLPPSTSDYVMVEGSDEGESDSAPPPPPRAGRPAPPRAPPVPPTDTTQPSESISSQWEMPSIPSVDFGESAELSLSWTDDITSSTQPPSEHPSLPKTSSNQVLSPDDLIAVWGKVGVQICEVATNLHEKSKKTLIGDGSYRGFIEATLREVPNAAPIAGQDYGYLVYMQSAASVQKRASDILPGDIVSMHDAKFKGHKGLQNYSQNVEELVGVVFEFEAKKFKIRVFQANQHVGQQTVEAVSYRLEDLKSGAVKIFRVLEA